MGDFLKWLITGVVPPRGSDDALYKWQTSVAAAIYAGLFSIVAIVVLSFGLTPLYTGFAKASDEQSISALLKTVIDDQHQSHVIALQGRIDTLRSHVCKIDKNNTDAIGFANEQLNTLRSQYYQLTSVYPPLTPCELL